jgi:hypothetical protein
MYDIQLISFIRQLLPPHLRKVRIIALCATLFAPLDNLFTAFANYRRAAKLEITATGQIIVLEYNLSRLVGLPVGYIYLAGSVNADFSVLIPTTLTAQQEEEIRRYVAAHKLIGKSFEIVRNI